LQLEEVAIAKFKKTNIKNGLQLDMECIGHPRFLEKYIEDWRIHLWEHGFLGFSKDKDAYSKTKAFGEHKHTNLAVKRLIFRYFCPLGTQTFPFLHPIAL
jgi:hypothetical protein